MLLYSRWGLIPGRVTYRVLQHLLLIIPEAVRLHHCRDAEVEKNFTVRQATLLFDALSQVADSTLNRQPCPSANVALRLPVDSADFDRPRHGLWIRQIEQDAPRKALVGTRCAVLSSRKLM